MVKTSIVLFANALALSISSGSTHLRELTNAIFAPYVLSVPSNVLLDKSGMVVWTSGGWTRNTEAKTKEQLQSLLEADSKEKPLGSD